MGYKRSVLYYGLAGRQAGRLAGRLGDHSLYTTSLYPPYTPPCTPSLYHPGYTALSYRGRQAGRQAGRQQAQEEEALGSGGASNYG